MEKTMSKYIINVPKAKTFTKSMAAPFLAALAAYGFNVGIPGFVLLFRVASGKIRKLLGRSLKVEKGEKVGVLTKVMYLSPSKEAGINTCLSHRMVALLPASVIAPGIYSSQERRLPESLRLCCGLSSLSSS